MNFKQQRDNFRAKKISAVEAVEESLRKIGLTPDKKLLLIIAVFVCIFPGNIAQL